MLKRANNDCRVFCFLVFFFYYYYGPCICFLLTTTTCWKQPLFKEKRKKANHLKPRSNKNGPGLHGQHPHINGVLSTGQMEPLASLGFLFDFLGPRLSPQGPLKHIRLLKPKKLEMSPALSRLKQARGFKTAMPMPRITRS